MGEQQASRQLTIVNEQGLHARPAALIVQTAQQFQSRIEFIKENHRVDARSVLQLLTLFAPAGTELALHAEGPDAEAALAALTELIEQRFHE